MKFLTMALNQTTHHLRRKLKFKNKLMMRLRVPPLLTKANDLKKVNLMHFAT